MKRPARHRFVEPLLALVAACALSSCGIGFNRDWNAAKSAPHDELSGAWEGSWHSEATGHKGKLKAIISKPDPAHPKDRTVRYWASWKTVLRATFATQHTFTPQGQHYLLTGYHQMPGWVGGQYTYGGTATSSEFKATYRSSLDHGTFEMRR